MEKKDEKVTNPKRKLIKNPWFWTTVVVTAIAAILFFTCSYLGSQNDKILSAVEANGMTYDEESGNLLYKDDSDEEETSYSSESSSTSSSSSSTSTSSSPTSTSSSSSSKETFDPNSYAVPNYDDWNHDKVTKYSDVQATGKVLQVMKGDSEVDLRIAIDDDYDKVILVAISDYNYKDVIAEDDNVTIYGYSTGLTTYETTLGAKKTLPSMIADKYTVNSYGQ